MHGRAIMRMDIKTLLLVLCALFISAQPSAAWNYNSGAVPPGSKVNVEFQIVFINGEQCTPSTIQSVINRVAAMMGVDPSTVSVSACSTGRQPTNTGFTSTGTVTAPVTVTGAPGQFSSQLQNQLAQQFPTAKSVSVSLNPVSPPTNTGTTGTSGATGNTGSTTVSSNAVTTRSISPIATGRVVGDPHFTGFDGKDFDFQGKDNKVYVLLSDEEVELRTLLGEDFMYKGTTVMRSIGLQVGKDKIRADIMGDPVSNTWHMTLSINNKEEDLDHDIDVTLPDSGLRLMFTPPIPGEDSRVMVKTEKYVFVFAEPKNIEDPTHPRFHDRFDMAIEVLEAPTKPLGGVLGETWPTPSSATSSPKAAGSDIPPEVYEVSTIFKIDSFLTWFKAKK